MKKNKIFLLVAGGIMALIFSLIFTFFKRDIIIYNERYVSSSNDLWVEFYKDGTCNRNIASDYCNYKIEKDMITLEETQTVYGTTIKLEMKFRIIDKENLEHIHTCFPDYSDAHPDFNCNSKEGNLEKLGQSVKYSVNNKYTKQEEQEKQSVDNEKEEYRKYFNKTYVLVKSNDGKTGTIKFLGNNKCEIDMRSLDRIVNIGPVGKPSYVNVKYNNDGVCSYNIKDDFNVVVKYNGTYNITMPQVPQLSQKNVYVFQNPIQEMEITFNEDFESFNITNGNFKMSNYAVYFTDFVSENNTDDDKNNTTENLEQENSNNSNNSNNSRYEYRYRDRKEIITWTGWSEWSTDRILADDSHEVETRDTSKQTYKTIYKYKHFICPVPEYLTPKGNSTPYETECSGKGYWEYIESDYPFKFGNSAGSCNIGYGGYYDYKKYNGPYEKEVCWFENGTREEEDQMINITEYRYRLKITKYEWGDWSEWSTQKFESSDNREVQERVVY